MVSVLTLRAFPSVDLLTPSLLVTASRGFAAFRFRAFSVSVDMFDLWERNSAFNYARFECRHRFGCVAFGTVKPRELACLLVEPNFHSVWYHTSPFVILCLNRSNSVK
jgi:hypothetical protein